MKKLVKALSIINIISLIPILVLIIVHTPLAIYSDTYTIIFRIILIFVGISAFASAIIELENKNRPTGIINIIITVITVLASIKINYFETFMAVAMVIILLVLTIANLILQCKKSDNKLNSMLIFIIVIFTIIELICVSIPLFYIYKDIKNLENALPKLHEQKNLTTFVYEKEDKYIFLDNKGNKIAEKDFDDLVISITSNGYLYDLKINNDIANLGVARKGNKTIMINSEGEEIFEIYNLFEKSALAYDFMQYIYTTKKFGIEKVHSRSSDNYYNLTSTNVLPKYTGNLSSFEEDENREYMYFKNDEIMDKILQVVINPNEKESDIKLATNYLELDFNEELHRDTSKIREFYKNKKEYYLLDVENNTKTKLECNNLIYEAYYNENEELCENILLYTNGTIPFYDTEESGYFEKSGEKKTIKSSYLLLDITDKYYILFEKENETTNFLSTETGKLEGIFKGIMKTFNSFYIRTFYNNKGAKHELLDQNLNEITIADSLSFAGNNFIVACGDGTYDDYKKYIYYYDNNEITLLETLKISDDYSIINSSASKYNTIKENGESIYYKVGIISYKTEDEE